MPRHTGKLRQSADRPAIVGKQRQTDRERRRARIARKSAVSVKSVKSVKS